MADKNRVNAGGHQENTPNFHARWCFAPQSMKVGSWLIGGSHKKITLFLKP